MDRGTVLYLHQTYYNIFKRMNIILPLLERATLILYTNPLKYLVKYYYKDLFTRKVMTLRTVFYDILDQNGGLFKLPSSAFARLPSWTRVHTPFFLHTRCTIFLLPCRLKYGIIQKGLTLKNLLAHIGGSLVFFYCIGHLRGALL